MQFNIICYVEKTRFSSLATPEKKTPFFSASPMVFSLRGRKKPMMEKIKFLPLEEKKTPRRRKQSLSYVENSAFSSLARPTKKIPFSSASPMVVPLLGSKKPVSSLLASLALRLSTGFLLPRRGTTIGLAEENGIFFSGLAREERLVFSA